MFKAKTVELPEIPSLSAFPAYAAIAATIAEKNVELQACKNRVSNLRKEMAARFDPAAMNPEKRVLQKAIAAELPVQESIEAELLKLEPERQRIVRDISADICRTKFRGHFLARYRRHLELLRELAAIEASNQDDIGRIDRAGIESGYLPPPFYVINIGRESDPHSVVTRILSEALQAEVAA
jgi:hypothetical protein